MKNKNENNLQKKFITHIVQYLHMDITDFRKYGEDDKCYESIIYKWVIKLYQKGVTSERAIQIIYRARIFILTRDNLYLDSLRNSMQ